MNTMINKIKNRIKTRQMIEGGVIEEIQITKKEAEKLGEIKRINNVRLIIVDKLKDLTKTDCYAYINRNGHRSCYCLESLYCTNEKCNFYRNDINILDIEEEIKQYEKRRLYKRED